MPLYYTVESSRGTYRAKYLNEHGKVVNAESAYDHLTDVDIEFKRLHPGAKYLKPDDFRKRANQAADERAKLAEWTQK